MIEQIKTFENNCMAVDVIDGFTETDEQICQKWFKKKLDEGYEHVNVLVKLDELKLSQSNLKAFMEDTIWALRHYKQLGHLAIVAHSNILKAFVPLDNLFFQRASEGRYERYFDISQLDEAFEFINEEN
jgi:hypothetical protein